jgi:hypothetical protein
MLSCERAPSRRYWQAAEWMGFFAGIDGDLAR